MPKHNTDGAIVNYLRTPADEVGSPDNSSTVQNTCEKKSSLFIKFLIPELTVLPSQSQ
jgi:hypothetical protein